MEGRVAAGFEQVREAFGEDHASDPGGAQLCVYLHGEPVVDLATGRDPANDRPYGLETLGVLMSCTKAVVATVVLRLAERGLVDLEAPVARVWPEFAAAGKGEITLAQVLSHSSGLAAFAPEDPVSGDELFDWARATAALAAMRPLWPPGEGYLYHFITHGFLLGEVVRRVTGRTVGQVVAEEICGPLGLDLWIGLPPHLARRVAPHFLPKPGDDEAALRKLFGGVGLDLDDRLVRALIATMVSTYGLIEAMKAPRALAAEVPAGNGVGNARSLAKFYAALIGEVDGVRLLSPSMLDQALRPRTDAIGPPAPLAAIRGPSPQRFGLGFELPRTGLPFLGPGSFGHPGAGGRLGWANPKTGVALAYVCNNMLWDGATADPRWTRWLPALLSAVGAPAMA